MAGGSRRNRQRRRRAKVLGEVPAPVEPAEDSPKTSSSSSSAGSTGRTAQRKIPQSRLHLQAEDDDDDGAWPQSDIRAMRRDLLNLIHRYYIDAISRLPPAELRTTLARGLLVGGHCFGPLLPVHGIIVNSIWYAAAFPLRAGATDAEDDDGDEVRTLLATDGILRICQRSLQGLVASLRHYCPSLSTADALYQLMNADADLATAVALANGTTKSTALQAMISQNLVAFHLAAEAARHPDPTTFAHFASSLLPTVSAKYDIPSFLLIHRFLSAGDINHLSSVLVPGLPYEPRQPSLTLRPQVIDWITSQKQRFKDTGKQVLNVVNMASQHYTLQTGEQLILHSVCGVSLLSEQGPDNNYYYHINFLANRKGSGSAVGVPVLFFTEAVVLHRDEIDVHLCVLVDPLTDIGCCFACEKNKKKIVHPTYDEYCGCRDFEEDEVDCGSNFAESTGTKLSRITWTIKLAAMA